MSLFRIEKNKNYTVMSNYHLRDKTLSYKAKGMLSFMLSLPEDWDYSLNGLVTVSKEGIKSIRNILKELQDSGYLEVIKKQNVNGQFEYEYCIYEVPDTQKGDVDLGDVEKGIQINTKEINTNNKDKIDKECKEINELIKLLKENNCYDDFKDKREYIELFKYILENEVSYDLLKKIVVYIIKKLKLSDYKDENGKNISSYFNYLRVSAINNIDKIKNLENELW